MNNQQKLQLCVSTLTEILPLVYAQLNTFKVGLLRLAYWIDITTNADPFIAFTWSTQTNSQYKWIYVHCGDGGALRVSIKHRYDITAVWGSTEHITVANVAAGIVAMMQSDNIRDAINAIKQSAFNKGSKADE